MERQLQPEQRTITPDFDRYSDGFRNCWSVQQLWAWTGQQDGVGRLDIAPNSPITINLSNNPNPGSGTPRNDRLNGTSGNDLLDGLAGNALAVGETLRDRLSGLAGNDTLIGGAFIVA